MPDRERRRIQDLARARARGDRDARVMWLLPFGDRRRSAWSPRRRLPEDLSRELRSSETVWIREERDGHIHSSPYRLGWQGSVAFARRCRPDLDCFPPAFDDRLEDLCDVCLIGADADRLRSAARDEPNLRPATAIDDPADRVVADEPYILRWFEAAEAYRAELDRAEAELMARWTARRRDFSLSPRWQRRAFGQWQELVATSYDRLAAASERYRPVLAELAEAIGATATVYRDSTARLRRLYEWEQRQRWCLVRRGEDLLIARSDALGAEAAGARASGPLRTVYEAAWRKRQRKLRPVDWDEESIRRCDTELAALPRVDPPDGQTRFAQPPAYDPPPTFATWFRERFGVGHLHLSDREELARDRELRAAVRAQPRDSRPDNRGTGSYPTNPGGIPGHFGIHF